MSQTAYNNDYAAQQQQQQYNQQYNQYNNQQYPQQNQQHYHSSGYNNQQGYNQQQQQGYNNQQGYNQQQGFNQPQGFNQQQNFNQQQGFNQPQGFNQQQQGFNQQQGYNQQQQGFNQQQQQGYNQQQNFNQQQGFNQQQPQPGLNVKGHPVALHGFNSLTNLPYVQIRQGVEQMEVLSGFETSNKYAVLDPNGNLLMQCNDKSSMLAKLALGAGRSMDIKITDGTGAPIMDIKRPFKLYHKNVTITDPSGRLMGTIIKKFAIGKTIFHVMNARDEQLFTIRGGAFITVGPSRKFTITNSQGTEVGHIQKEFAGLLKEAFTDADNFSIHFPPGCDGETCALLVATTLFIDLSHFEK